MMEAVQDWAAALCLTALSAALLERLSPGGSMEKIFRFVLGAFVLCGLVAPLGEFLPAAAESIPAWSAQGEAGSFEQSVDTQILQAAKSNLRQVIAGEIYQMGYTCDEIEIFMDIAQDGRIVINKVAVSLCASEEECALAQARLEKATGLKTEVTAYGG